MNRKALLRGLLQGAVHNVSFDDVANLLEGLGFTPSAAEAAIVSTPIRTCRRF